MKYCAAAVIALISLLVISHTARGQHPPSTYTPKFEIPPTPGNFYIYAGTISLRHKFKIVFTDGSDTIVYSKVHADTPSYYLLLEDRSVKKKDPARFRKILPSQTRYIVRLDKYIVSRDKYVDFESKGISADSCWLFKAIDGKVSAYTPLAEDDVDDECLRYIQKENGPLIEVNSANLQQMIANDEKAAGQAKRKKYSKAIRTYNKSGL